MPSSTTLGVSVLLPVYNEIFSIGQTTRDVEALLSTLAIQFEILVIDDGSTDGSSAQVEGIRCTQVLRHTTNLGYGAALKTGLRAAKFDIIVIMDADGTYPVSAIPLLVDELRTADMVVGARIGPNVTYPWIRKLPKFLLTKFAEWIVGCSLADLNSGLRAFRATEARLVQKLLPDRFSFTTTITVAMLSNGRCVRFIPIDYLPRNGLSKFRPIRDTWQFAVTLLRLGVYFAPLRVFLPLSGLFFGAASITLCGDLFIRHDVTDRTIILFMAGAQIGLLALLADMINRRSS